MRKLLIVAILLFSTSLWAGNPTQDEFDDGSIADIWTTSGSGSKVEENGYLKMTSDEVSYQLVYQTNITGEFDIWISISDPWAPSEIPSAVYQGGVRAVITDNTDLVWLYQNRRNTANKNEIKAVHEVFDSLYTSNPEIDPTTPIYLRISRDASNVFHSYYALSLPSESGDWTELTPSTVLTGSGTVKLDFFVKDGGTDTFIWQFDWIRCWSGTCDQIDKPWDPCEGDYDGESDVDGIDLSSFGVGFPSDPICDLNADGIVDDVDFEIFSRDFGRNDCPGF